MRFEVPQFIEVEDKIFGPLTWWQFIYVTGGGGILAVLFIFTNFFIFILVGLPIAAMAFALAFYPVNDRPFSIFLEAVVRYLKGNKLYLWQKKGTGIYSEDNSGGSSTSQTPQLGTYTPPTNTNGINSLARNLELKAIQKPEQI